MRRSRLEDPGFAREVACGYIVRDTLGSQSRWRCVLCDTDAMINHTSSRNHRSRVRAADLLQPSPTSVTSTSMTPRRPSRAPELDSSPPPSRTPLPSRAPLSVPLQKPSGSTDLTLAARLGVLCGLRDGAGDTVEKGSRASLAVPLRSRASRSSPLPSRTPCSSPTHGSPSPLQFELLANGYVARVPVSPGRRPLEIGATAVRPAGSVEQGFRGSVAQRQDGAQGRSGDRVRPRQPSKPPPKHLLDAVHRSAPSLRQPEQPSEPPPKRLRVAVRQPGGHGERRRCRRSSSESSLSTSEYSKRWWQRRLHGEE